MRQLKIFGVAVGLLISFLAMCAGVGVAFSWLAVHVTILVQLVMGLGLVFCVGSLLRVSWLAARDIVDGH